MRLVYCTHPLTAPTKEGIAANIARAKRWYRWIATTFEVAVVADWIIMCEVLDDHNPDDRAYGLDANRAMIKRCDEIWNVGGKITSGCAIENGQALQSNLRQVDLTYLGDEPPIAHAPVEIFHLLAPLRKVRIISDVYFEVRPDGMLVPEKK